MPRLFKWVDGRLSDKNNVYKVFHLIISRRIGLDMNIIKLEIGNHIKEHTDIVADKEHYRLLFILKRPKRGGVITIDNPIIKWFNRIVLFRPDTSKHSVSEVEEGTLWLLTVGKILIHK